MVLELIAASVLLAFGIVAIYFSFEEAKNDKTMSVVLIVGVLAIIAGGWLFISQLSIAVVLRKIAGLVLAVIGGFLVFGYPGSSDYQKSGFAVTGIFIGMVVLIFGLFLLFF